MQRYFPKKYLIFALVAVLLAVVAFFTLQSKNPLSPESREDTLAVFTGEITGFPPPTGGASPRTAFFSIVDPSTARLTAIKEDSGELSSYRVETSPGWRMIILRVFDFDSGKMYAGASRAFNISTGETRVANIILEEIRTLNGISAETNLSARQAGTSATATRVEPAILKSISTIFQTLFAHAAEEKPVVAVIGMHTGRAIQFAGYISQQLLAKDYTLTVIDDEWLKILDFHHDPQNRPFFDPDTWSSGFTPSKPNFIVKAEAEVEEKPLYPNSDIIRTYTVTKVKISLINAENGDVVWIDESRSEHQLPGDVVTRIADQFAKRLTGEGPDAIKLPEFTPSVPTLTKELPSEWGAQVRKAAGLDKPPESGTGGTGPQTGTGSQQPQQPKPATTCNIPAFRACADTFSLQGCIDACPYVPVECPAGTPPNTDCKETDKACSDQCWATADSHLDSCLKSSHCTKEEVSAGGGGAPR